MQSALIASLSLYALLVLVGGVIGFRKANSRASLIAGIGFAVLLGVASSLVASGMLRVGAGLGAFGAFALIGRFLPAFLKTKKLMPAGAVVGLGAVVLTLGVLTLVSAA
jgi:uncharacterized membrane protein (UPF0136 family)